MPRKLSFCLILAVLTVAGSLAAASAVLAENAPSNVTSAWTNTPNLRVFTSIPAYSDTPHLVSNQTVTITALSATLLGEQVDRVTIAVDGQTTQTCDRNYVCQKVFGPFNISEETRAINYTVTASNQGLTSTRTGTFLVTRSNLAPRFQTQIYLRERGANNSSRTWRLGDVNPEISVGQELAAAVFPQEGTEISRIDVSVDGRVVKSCSYPWVCATGYKLLENSDAGEHSYQIVVQGVNGLTSSVSGRVNVRGTGDTTSPTVRLSAENPRRTLSASEVVYYYGDAIRILASASDNVGVKRIDIYESGHILKASCADRNECRLDLGPYPDSNLFGLIELTAEAYDAAGNKATTVDFYVDLWHASSDNIAPAVTLTADRYQATQNQSVTLTARATDNNHVSRIVMSWGVAELKTCNGTSTCTYTFNSLPPIRNVFKAVAYDDYGNTGNSGEIAVVVTGSGIVTTTPANTNLVTSTLTLTTDKSSYRNNETITITSRAAARMKKINILVNARVVKECADTDVCVFTGGPYARYAGTSVAYGSNAYDYANNRQWSGYRGVPVAR